MENTFQQQVELLFRQHNDFLSILNKPVEGGNGIFKRYQHPVLTAAHTPLIWRYDFDPSTNPMLLERIGMGCAFNSGAIKWDGKYIMVVRVEGSDRKSFFAIAESPNGIDNFRFWNYPVLLPDEIGRASCRERV